MAKISKGSRIQVIDRAVTLLDAVARYPGPVSLKILSAETGLHASTTHRILTALIDNGLIERQPGGYYRLGMHLLQLGLRLHTDIDLRSTALPHMESLRDKLGESVNLAIREGDILIYIDKAVSNRIMHVQQFIGSRAPLHVTAVGKLILGASGEEEINGYVQRTNLPTYTKNSITNSKKLLTECFESIDRGYGLDNGEAEIEVGCIGVLIYDSTRRVVGGISLSAPIERRQMKWVNDVMQTGKAISAQLGFFEN